MPLHANDILKRLAALSDPQGIGPAEWALALATDISENGIENDDDPSATASAVAGTRDLAIQVAELALLASRLLFREVEAEMATESAKLDEAADVYVTTSAR